ncbi:MAG: SpoIID/LytB domain-containing protein [Candidatus Sericytochromatia bacterium]
MKDSLVLGTALLLALAAPAWSQIVPLDDTFNSSPVMQSSARQDIPIHVQVQPSNTATALRVSATSRIKGLTALGWREVGHLAPDTTLSIRAQGGGIKVTNLPGSEIYKGLRVETPNQQAVFGTEKGWFRGHANLIAGPTSFSVVNEVPLEQYLCSVVPSEMPASWPQEALKSQAVAARTYVISHLGQHRKRGYDVTSTTDSQVYQGVKSEHPGSNQAVYATQGEILTHAGKPALTYFHSTSGGRTESGADLWANVPYLQPVDAPDEASPKYTWHVEVSQATLRQRLRAAKIDVGEVVGLQAAQFTSGGRVKSLRVVGTRGQQLIDGQRFRTVMQLNSTFFNAGGISAQGELLKQPDPKQIPVSFQFAGRGWGHGLGMSQWGARQMAVDGYSYQDILGHYYRGTRLEPLNLSRYQLALLR